jgi:hypothetical protein
VESASKNSRLHALAFGKVTSHLEAAGVIFVEENGEGPGVSIAHSRVAHILRMNASVQFPSTE